MIRDDHDYHGNSMQQFIVHMNDTYEDVMGSIGGVSINISPENTALMINPLYIDESIYTAADYTTRLHDLYASEKSDLIINMVSIMLGKELEPAEKTIIDKSVLQLLDINKLFHEVKHGEYPSLKRLYNIILDEYDKTGNGTEILGALDEISEIWPSMFDASKTNIGAVGTNIGSTVNYTFVIDAKPRDKRIVSLEILVISEAIMGFMRRNYMLQMKSTMYFDNLDEMLEMKNVTDIGAKFIMQQLIEITKKSRPYAGGIVTSVSNIEDNDVGTMVYTLLCNSCYEILLHNTKDMLVFCKEMYKLSEFYIKQIDDEHVVKPGDGIWYVGADKWDACKVTIDYHYGYVS